VPELAIIREFVANEDYKYVRALGAFYLRYEFRCFEKQKLFLLFVFVSISCCFCCFDNNNDFCCLFFSLIKQFLCHSLVGTPLEIYTLLEPHYADYRKLRLKQNDGM
jgi:hypothetical protein